MYRYRYDAQNRLTKAYSSRDSLVWTMEASYSYYLHGPLARMELGHSKVQGIDYGYTLQGWLKGVNGTVQSADMGNDGYGGSNTGRDALGLALHYNDSDYKSIQTLKHPFAVFSTTGLFNGNISAMTVSNHALGNALAYAYQYDQLNRLITKTSWKGLDTAVNRWTPVALPDYKESLRYDANGNILTKATFKPTETVQPPSNTTGIYLGTDGRAMFIKGNMRQFRLYERVLTLSEIAANRASLCRTPVNSTGIVAYVPFSEGIGNVFELYRAVQTTRIGISLVTWISQRKGIMPKHQLATTYAYNGYNQVTRQYTPDAGNARFFYDRIGRLFGSQNANQASTDPSKQRFSYTRYDAQGRIIEVGEKTSIQSPAHLQYYDLLSVQYWTQNGINKQVTTTIYDAPNASLVKHSGITGAQRNLRKRVVSTLYRENSTTDVYDNATHYSYDISGNVQTLWQEIGELRPYSHNGIKRVDYDYDLVSGKVNQVIYQPGKGDQYLYRYGYDAQNRLTTAYSSRDSLVWTMDAAYQYYLHGPLARVELGQHKVQGIDYAYTIQGWLKGVNGTVQSADMGNDGYGGSNTGRDALGLALHYNDSDYKSIQTLKHPFAVFSTTGLFNGNISAMTVSNHALGNALAYAYQYDQLNRLITKTSWKGLDTAVNRWTPVALPDYKESLRYDANGNILTNNRYGNAHKGQMDQLTYYYKTGTNQLRHVKDTIAAAGYSTDIDDQQPDNYSYDAIGNLIADKSERIDTISWTVYGKIAGIKKRNGTIRYKYDAAGNRVYKQSVLDGKTNTSFYVRDAQGNVLGVYDLNEKGLSWEEQHLYGSSRLGVYRYGSVVPLQPVTTKSAAAVVQDSMAWGSRVYELSNHLGNVLATVSDKKLQVAGTGNTVAYYRAEILSANDYFAFGSLIEDRSFSVGNGYRYGFNGQEKSNDVTEGNYTAEYWEYDSRTGRRWNIDPKASSFPWQSPYAAFDNNPILKNDPTGESGEVTINKQSKTITVTSNLTLYGGAASAALAKSTAKDIQDKWNAAGGKVKIDGVEYKVQFSVTGSYDENLTAGDISKNKDIKNNYIRVEETVAGNISYMDDAGSNTGYYLLNNIKSDGSTTEGHEFGHGYGLEHPEDGDLRGEGQPGIMAARGTLVDGQYQYNPKAKAGEAGGTINPEKRKVTSGDIKNLGLDKLKYDKNGKANLGKLTNTHHEKTK